MRRIAGSSQWKPKKGGSLRKRVAAYELDTMKRSGSHESLFSPKGEINANDRRDARKGALDYMRQRPRTIRAMAEHLLNEYPDFREALVEYKKSEGKNKVYAAAVSTMITEVIREFKRREGFTARILNPKPIEKGQIRRIKKTRTRPNVYYQSQGRWQQGQWQNGYFYPTPEREPINLTINGEEMDDAEEDFLEELQGDTFEHSARKTDLKTYQFLTIDPAIDAAFTPMTLNYAIKSSLYKISTILMCTTMMANFLDIDNDWHEFYSETFKHELLSAGQFGEIMGAALMTESLWEEDLRVIQEGEYFFLSEPTTLGDYYYDPNFELEPLDLKQQQRDAVGFFGIYLENIYFWRRKAFTYYKTP